MSRISILGLYQHDQTLFDNMLLPEDFSAEERLTLINNLLMDCAEFECVYPNFDFCKAAIGWWSKARLSVWEKLYASTMFDYNPIWNKDGTITENRTRTYSDEKTGEAATSKTTGSETTDGVAGSKLTSSSQDIDTENKTAGFNSSSYVNKDKQTVDQSFSETITDRTTRNVTDSGTESGSTTESGTTSGEESEEYTRTEQGNIGVTSTQQLIKEEREVVQFEIDDYIINDFKKQFCILVY